LPAARRCQRVRFSIFLCFFLRMRLRRFLISEPMRCRTLAGTGGMGAQHGGSEPVAGGRLRPPVPLVGVA
jgi:hypothetical protein